MIQAFVDRVKATYVVYRDSWEQKRQEEGFQVSCRLKERALALVNRIIPDAPISEVIVPDGQKQVAYICIRMSLYTFMRLTYRKLERSSGHFDERLEFGSKEIRHEADFGRLVEEGTWPGRAVCPSCLSELGWRAKALVHGTFTRWDLLPGGVLRGTPDTERDYSDPYDKELFCPLCNIMVEPGDFLTEILPERQC